MTITEAVRLAMKTAGTPMSANEAFEAIVEAGLYEFHADDPAAIVRTQIRRHCAGLDFPSASSTKYFRPIGDGRYEPLPKPVRTSRSDHSVSATRLNVHVRETNQSASSRTLIEIQELYQRYLSDLKERMVLELKRLSPEAFERFARRLLDVYGFHDTRVTGRSSDGGIDGHGKLKVGLAYLHVAFQCKRWTKSNVQRPEIDKFRGAAQGEYEQGLFFTTSAFSQGAIDASIKKGAIPIILIDGPAIVDLMIEKKFGVQVEVLALPTQALDLAL